MEQTINTIQEAPQAEGTTVAASEVVAENATVETVLEAPKVEESKPVETVGLKSLLADDLKEVKSLGNFKDVNDLAKSYMNLNSLLGKKVSEWSKEQIDAFAVKMGRPESSEGYVLPEEMGEGSKEFKDFAFKANLSQEQAKILADEIILNNRSKSEKLKLDSEAKIKEIQTELRKEFGDAYDKRMSLASKAIVEVGGESLLKAINESGLGMNIDLIKGFARLGKDYFESDKTVKADRDSTFGVTPDEAKKMIQAKLMDIEFKTAYLKGNKAAIEEMARLHALANS